MRPTKKQKVLIGIIDVANQAVLIKKGFEQIGFDATTIILTNQHKHSYDIGIVQSNFLPSKVKSRLQLIYHFVKSLFKFQIYIFQGGETFFYLKDLWILKLLGKKIIMLHNGSETRYWPAFLQMKYLANGNVPYIPSFNDLKENRLDSTLKRIIYSERYSDLIVSTLEINLFGTKDFMHFYVPFESSINSLKSSGKSIKIAHSPSNTLIKGTVLVEQSIKKLIDDGYEISYKRLENLSNENVLKELANTDIFIEQIGNILHGKNAVEAMFMECIVLSEIDKNLIPQIKECPIISVNQSTIYETLKEVLENIDSFRKYGVKGREYVEKYHSPKEFAASIFRNIGTINDNQLKVKPFYTYNKFHTDHELKEKIIKIEKRYNSTNPIF